LSGKYRSIEIRKALYLTPSLSYIIPNEDGDMQTGERLFNWLYYYNVSESSPQMTEIFTDKDGQIHQNSVSRGSVNYDVWKKVRDSLQICDAFRELVEKTPNPFITKVIDVSCDTATFFGGKVVLVGDAFTTLGPNLAAAADQAAFHSNSLVEVYRGEKTQASWDLEVRLYAQRLILLSNVVAELGRGTIFSLFRKVLAYLWFAIKQRLYGSRVAKL
jgi:hypothetical protein